MYIDKQPAKCTCIQQLQPGSLPTRPTGNEAKDIETAGPIASRFGSNQTLTIRIRLQEFCNARGVPLEQQSQKDAHARAQDLDRQMRLFYRQNSFASHRYASYLHACVPVAGSFIMQMLGIDAKDTLLCLNGSRIRIIPPTPPPPGPPPPLDINAAQVSKEQVIMLETGGASPCAPAFHQAGLLSTQLCYSQGSVYLHGG